MASLITWRKIKLNTYVLVFFIAFLVLFPISMTLCLPIYLIRFVVAMARKLFRPDLGKMITTRSAVIATDNPSKNPQWNLCVWLVLEGDFDFERFRENFLSNIVYKKDAGGTLLHPEYQQFYKRWIGFLFWKWEEKFDIKEHMRYLFSKDENCKSKPTSDEELKKIIKDLTAKPFEQGKSPWEFLFLPNYLETGDSTPQKSVLIFRVHHGFCDGFTILWLLMKEVNNISMENVAKPAELRKNIFLRILTAATFWIRAPYDFLKLIVKSKDNNEWHLPEDQLQRPFNTAFTRRIPLDYIKSIKSSHNVSFTAVVMAALTGGLRQKMLEKGVKVPDYVTTAIAVPMPGHPTKLRNHL
jgi:hypothetical protein